MTSTAPAPEYTAAVDRLAEASARLADFAQQQGVSRAQAAADIVEQVGYAAATDPVLEQARAKLRADVEQYQADARAYTAAVPEMRAQLLEFVARFAALADEVTAATDEGAALDERGQALALTARSLGEPVQPLPQVTETVVQELRRDAAMGIPLARLLLSSRRNRESTLNALTELAVRLHGGR